MARSKTASIRERVEDATHYGHQSVQEADAEQLSKRITGR
jgi:hypothetical protein